MGKQFLRSEEEQEIQTVKTKKAPLREGPNKGKITTIAFWVKCVYALRLVGTLL